MPASYAVLSEEEMTYLDGGADYSFNVGDYTVTLHPEVLVTYAMNVVVNGVYMLSQGSFQYFINTFKEGLSDGLSLTGVVKHNWNRMNTWSRVATVGMAGLAGYYAYAQVRSMSLSLKNLFGSMFGTTTNTDTQDRMLCFRRKNSGPFRAAANSRILWMSFWAAFICTILHWAKGSFPSLSPSCRCCCSQRSRTWCCLATVSTTSCWHPPFSGWAPRPRKRSSILQPSRRPIPSRCAESI